MPQPTTTTFLVSAGADDGFVYRSAASYPPTSGTLTIDTTNAKLYAKRSFDSAGNLYSVYVALLRFDTSGLGTAVAVTNATLRLFVSAKGGEASRPVIVEWYAWTPPITGSYWTSDPPGAGTAPEAARVSLADIATNTYNDFPLTGATYQVNRTGITGFRIHIGGGQPTGNNFLECNAYESPANVAQLVVTTVPLRSVPTASLVVTSAAGGALGGLGGLTSSYRSTS